MKNHVKATKIISVYGDKSLEDLMIELHAIDLKNAVVDAGDGEIFVEGWRPMTKAEMEAAERRRLKQQENERLKKIAKEEFALAKLRNILEEYPHLKDEVK